MGRLPISKDAEAFSLESGKVILLEQEIVPRAAWKYGVHEAEVSCLILSVTVPHLFQIHFYGPHKGKDPILHIKAASLVMHHQDNVHMLYALVLFIRKEHDEYGHCMAVYVWLDALWLEAIFSDQAL